MMTLAARVDQMLRGAAIPFLGVSILDPGDKQTWVVRFSDVATDAQKAQAAALIAAFQMPTAAQLKDESAIRDIDARALKAVVMELYPYLSAGKPSLAQLRQNIIDRYKALNGS